MYSIILTAAIFIAMILNDVLEKRTNRISRHAFLGMLATGLVTILWYLNYELVGWGLITIPILALVISYSMIATGKSNLTPTNVSGTIGKTIDSTPAPACAPSNLAGPYTAIAPPPPSTVSLPAVPPTPTTTAMTTNTPAPKFNITPVTGC